MYGDQRRDEKETRLLAALLGDSSLSGTPLAPAQAHYCLCRGWALLYLKVSCKSHFPLQVIDPSIGFSDLCFGHGTLLACLDSWTHMTWSICFLSNCSAIVYRLKRLCIFVLGSGQTHLPLSKMHQGAPINCFLGFGGMKPYKTSGSFLMCQRPREPAVKYLSQCAGSPDRHLCPVLCPLSSMDSSLSPQACLQDLFCRGVLLPG